MSRRIGAVLALALVSASAPAQPSAPLVAPDASKWVGVYDGGQMELAAMLELRADERFAFALSYGALDEAAEGRWILERDSIRLEPDRYATNDPENREQRFGNGRLAISGHSLTTRRYGRLLKFSRH